MTRKFIGYAMMMAVVAMAFLASPVMAAESTEAAESGAETKQTLSLWYAYDSGKGADGYDVVAYFSDKVATRGAEEFFADYDGQTWYFTTAANRDIFIAAPQKYAPQYGGYCAYAASLNALAYGDPKVWTVQDDKLYFNYNIPTQVRWENNAAKRIIDADKLWSSLVARNAAN